MERIKQYNTCFKEARKCFAAFRHKRSASLGKNVASDFLIGRIRATDLQNALTLKSLDQHATLRLAFEF